MKDFATRQSLWKHKQRFHKDPSPSILNELDDIYSDSSDHKSEFNTSNKESKESEEDRSGEESAEPENESEEEEMEEESLSNKDEIEDTIDIDIWKGIAREADLYENGDALTAFKDNVNFAKRLLADETYRKVMTTLKKAQFEDDMDFDEAFTYAIKKRKVLILRAIEEARKAIEEEEKEEEKGGEH